MIHLNKHPAGRGWNVLFGLAVLIDGIVRILSLGYLHTTLSLIVTREQTRVLIKRMKRMKRTNDGSGD